MPPTMDAGGDHVAIDVDTMTSNLERKLSLNLVMPSQCSIFKIPTILSRHIKDAYKPNAFSIGPFHHKDPQLKPTQRIKKKYLLDLISRLSNQNPPNPITPETTLLRNFTKAISDAHSEIFEYYAGPIEMNRGEFIEMLVLDGCFIIELFRKNADPNLRDKEDPIFTMSCMLQFLYHDLILLENQIPWLVLDKLFSLTKPTTSEEKPLVQLAIEFFPSLLKKTRSPIENILSSISGQESKHILDLLRNSLIFSSKISERERSTEFQQWQRVLSATGLRDSGITFNPDFVSDSILDITFNPETGLMSIPPLLIQETTETVFRNLISLEQCCPNYKPIITSYAVLLDNLIDTNDDIRVLDKSKVIINWLNIDDATKFFNKLYIDTFVKEYYYFQLTCAVKKYCKGRRHRYCRVLRRDYFKHPWSIISVIAASIVLILTFLQTLYAMKGK